MIIKGASRRSISFWSRHLTDQTTNQRVTLIEQRGFAAVSLLGMMREMRLDATLTDARNFMYIASFNPCPHEQPTERQWERMLEIFEEHRGIPSGQQRVVYEHTKRERTHRHVIWNRVDLERLIAFPDSLDFRVCESAQKQIEHELGMEPTRHLLNRDPGEPRPARGPKSWEMYRGQRSSIDPRNVTAEVTAAFQASTSSAEFLERLRTRGYEACRGDRRAYCIVDAAGDVHSLARRIDGVNTRQLKEFLRDLDPSAIPTLEFARASFRQQNSELAAEVAVGAVPINSVNARSLEAEVAPKQEAGLAEQLTRVAGPNLNGISTTDGDATLAWPLPPTADAVATESTSILVQHEQSQVGISDVAEDPPGNIGGWNASLKAQFKTLAAGVLAWARPANFRKEGFKAACTILRRMNIRAYAACSSVYWCYLSNNYDPILTKFICEQSRPKVQLSLAPKP